LLFSEDFSKNLVTYAFSYLPMFDFKFIFPLIAASSISSSSYGQSTTKLDPMVIQDYALEEDKPVGAFGQPEWVKQRRFSTTRIHLQKDPWEWGVEEWYRVRTFDGGKVTQRSQIEFEMGLPYRMQLDIYNKSILDNTNSKGWQQDEFSIELRYAFADWGKLPLNPALYLEYAFADEGADIIEPKILFGDDFGKGWHWGLNFIAETQVWGERTP
jgi:hypothetical protein